MAESVPAWREGRGEGPNGQERGPFTSLFNFCLRVDRTRLNKRALLIFLTALDDPFLAEERRLVDSIAEMLRSYLERRKAIEALQAENANYARQHAALRCPCHGNRQNPRTRADVKHPPRRADLQRPVDRREAALRRAVMAGAEGERRLDLDAGLVGLHTRAVMRSMDDKAADRHRRETREARRDPVLFFDA